MDILIRPGKLHGEYFAPPSKSDFHRALICAAFADRPVTLSLPSSSRMSEDILATIRCLEALGANILFHYDASYYGTDVFCIVSEEGTDAESGVISSILVDPVKHVPQEALLDCGESGSTLRLLLPAASSVCPRAHFTGHGRLPDRPLAPLPQEMQKHGFSFSAEKLPFTVTRSDTRSGTGKSGAAPEYTLPGNISSQYISGLLIMGALGDGIRITLTTPLESAPYVEMTIRTLASFGIRVKHSGSSPAETFEILPGGKLRSPGTYIVEGDWSNASFFLAADLLSGGQPVCVAPGTDPDLIPENEEERLLVYGLTADSPQGDRIAPDIIRSFMTDSGPEAVLNAKDIPDLVPVLSVAAYLAKRSLTVTGSARLRLKESDRIETTVTMLRALGAKAEALPDGLRISAPASPENAAHSSRPAGIDGTADSGTEDPFIVDAAGDHRIAMAAAVAGICGDRPVLIRGAEAAAKSYPSFYSELEDLTDGSVSTEK